MLHFLIIFVCLRTPFWPIIKRFIGKNKNRLCGNHLLVTTEPVSVKMYMKTLADRGFRKKKLDTRYFHSGSGFASSKLYTIMQM